MSSADHGPRGLKKGQFCAVAPDRGKCECGNDYRENGKAPATWGSSGVQFLSKRENVAFRYFEAHHILSVAPITAILLGTNGIQTIVRNTKWCINNTDNMIAMPMMAHTVHWYEEQEQVSPPPFANLPQHDWDHLAYLTEVKEKLRALVKTVKEKSKEHETSPKNIRDDMVELNKFFRTELTQRRGKLRGGGTHVAYSEGICAPFSMASDGRIHDRPFPTGALSKKVKEWRNRILGAKG